MKSLIDQLPPEIARQIHPDWRKNEAEYWAARDRLLGQYRDQWIGFADGRWVHAQRGVIPPDEFIPLAENTGLIRPLSRWVLNEALRQCRAWQDADLYLPVSVNLSTRVKL